MSRLIENFRSTELGSRFRSLRLVRCCAAVVSKRAAGRLGRGFRLLAGIRRCGEVVGRAVASLAGEDAGSELAGRP